MILHQGKRYNQVRVLNPTPLDVNINGTTVVNDTLTDVNLTLVDQNGDDVPFAQTGTELEINTEWQRPLGWLPIPTINTGEEVIYILCRVDNDSATEANRLAFTVAGNYTVDWGDGSPLENVLSGVTAYKQFSWASVGNDFNGYRQALIKVTPQAGQNITSVSFNVINISGSTIRNSTNVLDIVANIPNVSGNIANVFGNLNQLLFRCERVWLKQIGILTGLNATFSYMPNLKSLPVFDTSQVVDFTSTLFCCGLRTFNGFSIASNVTSFTNFAYFSGLEHTDININLTTSCGFNNLAGSSGIKKFGNIATTSGVAGTYAGLFSNDSRLEEVGNISIPTTSFSTWFSNCYTLIRHGIISNSVAVTTMANMYVNCFQMIETELTVPSVTVTTSAFQNTGNFTKIILNGLKVGISIAGNKLSATALNDLFTSLGTASGSQTITITGNPGAATCNPSIATSKGFTVVI